MKTTKGQVTITLSPPKYDYGYLDIKNLCELAVEYSELENICAAFNEIKEKVSQEFMKGEYNERAKTHKRTLWQRNGC